MGNKRSGHKSPSKDETLLNKLKRENKTLKQQVASLRKQLSRIDVDRYENLTDLVDQLYDEEKAAAEEVSSKSREQLMKKWECFKCHKDYLKLIILARPDGAYYFRKCSCGKKTRLQKYTKDVEGLED